MVPSLPFTCRGLLSLMGLVLIVARPDLAAADPRVRASDRTVLLNDIPTSAEPTPYRKGWLRLASWLADPLESYSDEQPIVFVELDEATDDPIEPEADGETVLAPPEVLRESETPWIGPESGPPTGGAGEWEEAPEEECDCEECRERAFFGRQRERGRPRGRLRGWWQGLGSEGPRGEPLHGESWLNRPFSFGVFGGMLALSDPIDGSVDGNNILFVGSRVGWDYAEYYGIEARLGYAAGALNYPLDPVFHGDMDAYYLDAHWLYYPWGDTRWRPFFSVGGGMADFHFPDHQGIERHETLFGFPWGVGVKYRVDSRLAFRAEFQDNINFAAGDVDSMHNISLTAGLEWRFGGSRSRKSYFPWNPSKSWW